jgi:hypothetical protein
MNGNSSLPNGRIAAKFVSRNAEDMTSEFTCYYLDQTHFDFYHLCCFG